MKTSATIALALAALTFSACTSIEEEQTEQFYTEEWDALVEDGKDDSVKIGRFETFTGRDGKYYFHLLAGNGQKVLKSQGYKSKAGAENGIETVRFNGEQIDAFQLLESVDGQWYFNLLAGNWEIIGTSELYVSKSNAERARNTVAALVYGANQAAAARAAKFQVFRGLDGNYYFHVRAGNGEIVLQSQGYTRRSSALAGTASVQANGTDIGRYLVRDAANGQSYFVLLAGNGQVIGVSETYVSRSNAERGAATVAALVKGATIAQAQ